MKKVFYGRSIQFLALQEAMKSISSDTSVFTAPSSSAADRLENLHSGKGAVRTAEKRCFHPGLLKTNTHDLLNANKISITH